MATAEQRMTAEELERMPPDQSHVELVRGEILVMTPSGFEHAKVAARISVPLGDFVRRSKLGEVCVAEGGFVLSRHQFERPNKPFTSQIGRRRTSEMHGRQSGADWWQYPGA